MTTGSEPLRAKKQSDVEDYDADREPQCHFFRSVIKCPKNTNKKMEMGHFGNALAESLAGKDGFC